MIRTGVHSRLVVGLLVLVGCGGGSERPDAGPRDDVLLTDGPPDAQTIKPDAFEPSDPLCAGPSPSCVAVPTTVVPVLETSNVAGLTRAGDTLYLSTYELGNDGSPFVEAGRITSFDLVTGTMATPLEGAFSYGLSPAGDAVIVGEDRESGSVWRIVPGSSPVEVATGRNHPTFATADATHVYWIERITLTTHAVKRTGLAGGTVEDVTSCDDAAVLIVDDSYVYCARFGQSVLRAPKSGGTAQQIASSTYPYTAMIACSGSLYATNAGERTISEIPTPSGPGATFATVAGLGRFYGITATHRHFYTTTLGPGIFKIDRITKQYEHLVPAAAPEVSPVAWNGQLLYFERNVGVRRCVD